MPKLLTVEQLAEIGFDCKVVGRELRVFHGNDVTCFRWPMTWSPALLRWHILDRLGLRNPDLLPPPSNQCYNV